MYFDFLIDAFDLLLDKTTHVKVDMSNDLDLQGQVEFSFLIDRLSLCLDKITVKSELVC